MDTNNERRIFELIVDCTCQETSSQYFLITPKLVPNLNYSRNMAVHIVHNGPFIAQDKKVGVLEAVQPPRRIGKLRKVERIFYESTNIHC